MFTARGSVKSSSNRIVGTFNVDGGTCNLSVNVNLPNQLFECSNATLTYSSVEKLVENCTWSGTIGKNNLRMDLSGGVSITGQLDIPRLSSVHVRGEGAWMVATTSLVSDSAGEQRQSSHNAFADQAQLAPDSFAAHKDPRRLERERQLLKSGAPIIVILGQSGTGKSSFINLVATEQQKVGNGLQPCTSEISVIDTRVGGQRVVVIDTPGIGDAHPSMTETDILVAIARCLESMGREEVWVTGVLFLHRITDNKFSPTANRVSNMLKSLCGDDATDHIMLCTTMWDSVSQDKGGDRFEELCNTGVWKEMVSKGASTGQFSSIGPNARKEAESIMEELITNARPVELAIQDEMINRGRSVAQTGVGQILVEHLREVRKAAEREMEEIRERMRKENAATAAKAEEVLLAHNREIDMLKTETEKQTRAAQANAERIQQEQEKAEREIKELRESIRTENTANTARLEEDMRARERKVEEMRRQAKEQARAQQTYAERLQQEREEADHKMRALQESIHAEVEANAARQMETMAARQHEIAELKRQNERLLGVQTPYPRWLSVSIETIRGLSNRVLVDDRVVNLRRVINRTADKLEARIAWER